MSTPAPGLDLTDPVFARLEDQITWYDGKSIAQQRTFKTIKVIEIVAAALIPFLAALKAPNVGYVTAGLGVLITVLEGLLHLNNYQENWINYRSTCEQLRHEKFVFLGNAPPYATANAEERRALLAERVESLVSQEHAKWASTQQNTKDTTK